MKSEGEQLRQFIDNQPKSKISIAKELGMSKQNLFGLFKSRVLEDETKSRFEEYFGQSIFSQDQSSIVEDEAAQYVSKSSLDKALENLTENNLKTTGITHNLTENELRTTAVIEKLLVLLDRATNSATPLPASQSQIPVSKPGDVQKAQEDLSWGKKYSKTKK